MKQRTTADSTWYGEKYVVKPFRTEIDLTQLDVMDTIEIELGDFVGKSGRIHEIARVKLFIGMDRIPRLLVVEGLREPE